MRPSAVLPLRRALACVYYPPPPPPLVTVRSRPQVFCRQPCTALCLPYQRAHAPAAASRSTPTPGSQRRRQLCLALCCRHPCCFLRSFRRCRTPWIPCAHITATRKSLGQKATTRKSPTETERRRPSRAAPPCALPCALPSLPRGVVEAGCRPMLVADSPRLLAAGPIQHHVDSQNWYQPI